ncbi:MAG: hypothetical protein KGY56_14975, partial [Desulfobacterales bacterium]|nr:hypothetical protein [Desulfobacterales bacterium]
ERRTIAAGEPLDVWDLPDDRIGVDPMLYGNGECFALRVKGDSMAGAHILDGDLAVIRPQADVDDGQIAAVLVAGILLEAKLKKVRKRSAPWICIQPTRHIKPCGYKGRKGKRGKSSADTPD